LSDLGKSPPPFDQNFDLGGMVNDTPAAAWEIVRSMLP
jgi:hypothetical protein